MKDFKQCYLLNIETDKASCSLFVYGFRQSLFLRGQSFYITREESSSFT